MTLLEHSPETIAGVRDSVVTRLAGGVPLAARESRYTSEVDSVLAAPWFHERVHELAQQLGRDDLSVYKEATACLREISARHDEVEPGGAASLTVFLGNGNGTFQPGQSFATVSMCHSWFRSM